jgi:hypothetical protein
MRDSRFARMMAPAMAWLFRHPAVLREYCAVRRLDQPAQVA